MCFLGGISNSIFHQHVSLPSSVQTPFDHFLNYQCSVDVAGKSHDKQQEQMKIEKLSHIIPKDLSLQTRVEYGKMCHQPTPVVVV